MNKIKWTVAVLCAVFISVAGYEVVWASSTATPTNATVLVNGRTHSMATYNVGGQVYARISDVAEALSGTVAQFNLTSTWDGSIVVEAGQAFEATPGRDVHIHSGARQAVVRHSVIQYNDGITRPWWSVVEYSLRGYTIGGVHFFRLADLSSIVGFDVNWNEAARSITIDTSRNEVPDHIVAALEDFLAARRSVFMGDSFAFVRDVMVGGNWAGTELFDPVTGLTIPSSEITRREYLRPDYVATRYFLHDINNNGIPEVVLIWGQTWEGCYGGIAEIFAYSNGAYRLVPSGSHLFTSMYTDSQNRLIMVDNGDLGSEEHRVLPLSINNGVLEMTSSNWFWGYIRYPYTVTTPALPGERLSVPRAFRPLTARLNNEVGARLRSEGRI